MAAAAAAARNYNRAQQQRAKEQAREEEVLQQALKAKESFESAEERQKWLESHDKDGSGLFESSEFGDLLKDVARSLLPDADERNLKVPDEMVVKLYKGREGLTVDEVYAALKRCISYIRSEVRLVELFNAVDTDGNGMLNRSELKSLLEKASPPGRKVSSADVTVVLNKCDVNADENIDLTELSLAVACWIEVIKELPDPNSIVTERKKSSACVLL